jgi:ribosomal protein S18 acetylase RimI-like enzyme
LYCGGWSGAAPAGWRIAAETTLVKMVWAGPLPALDEAFAAERLGPEHAAQALELVALTQPGPFGPRNLELGEYLGCFEGPRLVAMAGERMHAGTLREISGVCTHPAFQGRGLARRLMQRLLRREMQRGETPFLQVRRDNASAHDLYERMGFKDRQDMSIRILARDR